MKIIPLIIFLLGTLYAAPIKVGILHSLTGTMAASETPVVDATLLAIEQVNARGGLLGQKIEPIIIDGASSDEEFTKGAKKLILEEKVSVVFGCWTSASRIAVEPIFEENNNLLFYPVQYEGWGISPNIIYTGAAPNQQIIPAAAWSVDNIGKRFYLVGSDYVFPREANNIIKRVLHALGAEVVGESYIALGSDDVSAVVEDITATKPSVIFNTINGDTNQSFFQALRAPDATTNQIPVISSSIGINEIQAYGLEKLVVGDYACWNYFESLDTYENRKFINQFHQKFGVNRPLNDPMEAAYIGVYLWAKAVLEGKSVDPAIVQKAIKGQVYLAPEGFVIVDEANNHLWKTVRIARYSDRGDFYVVWSSGKPVKPNPFIKRFEELK